MLAYRVEERGRENRMVKTTLHLQGEVTSGDWEKLRELCLSALHNGEQLVLNLEKVTGYDYSLSIFVCLLRRTVQLLKKRLSVKGKQQENFICVYEAALDKTKPCSLAKAGDCCLWENLYSKNTLERSLSNEPARRFGGDCICGQGGWRGCPEDGGR